MAAKILPIPWLIFAIKFWLMRLRQFDKGRFTCSRKWSHIAKAKNFSEELRLTSIGREYSVPYFFSCINLPRFLSSTPENVKERLYGNMSLKVTYFGEDEIHEFLPDFVVGKLWLWCIDPLKVAFELDVCDDDSILGEMCEDGSILWWGAKIRCGWMMMNQLLSILRIWWISHTRLRKFNCIILKESEMWFVIGLNFFI